MPFFRCGVNRCFEPCDLLGDRRLAPPAPQSPGDVAGAGCHIELLQGQPRQGGMIINENRLTELVAPKPTLAEARGPALEVFPQEIRQRLILAVDRDPLDNIELSLRSHLVPIPGAALPPFSLPILEAHVVNPVAFP